jgi:predicted metal-dependent peptidase
VSASSEDDLTTSLQPHVITSDTIISVGSILKHAVLKHFSRQLHANLNTSHRWMADIL